MRKMDTDIAIATGSSKHLEIEAHAHGASGTHTHALKANLHRVSGRRAQVATVALSQTKGLRSGGSAHVRNHKVDRDRDPHVYRSGTGVWLCQRGRAECGDSSQGAGCRGFEHYVSFSVESRVPR